MKTLVQKAGLLIGVGLLLFTAAAQDICTDARTVQVSGYSSEGAEGDTRLRQSLAQALANAIGQVNGTLLRHHTNLETIITTRLEDNTFTEHTLDTYQEVIEQTTAGVITSFQIVDEVIEDGFVRVDVLASVCTDPRVTLNLRGAPEFVSALEANLLPHLQTLGWRATVTSQSQAFNDVLAIYLETGSTLLLDISATPVHQDAYRGLQHVRLEVSGVLTDLRSEERTQAYALTSEGVGATTEAALQDAGTRAANTIARALKHTWSTPTQEASNQTGVTMRFTGVTRANTRQELETLLTQIPMVPAGLPLTWDAEAQTITTSTPANVDACAVGDALEGARRILLRVRECTTDTLEVDVFRE